MEGLRRKRRSPPEGPHDTLATVRCQRTDARRHATLTLAADVGRAAGGGLDAARSDSDEDDGAHPGPLTSSDARVAPHHVRAR